MFRLWQYPVPYQSLKLINQYEFMNSYFIRWVELPITIMSLWSNYLRFASRNLFKLISVSLEPVPTILGALSHFRVTPDVQAYLILSLPQPWSKSFLWKVLEQHGKQRPGSRRSVCSLQREHCSSHCYLSGKSKETSRSMYI